MGGGAGVGWGPEDMAGRGGGLDVACIVGEGAGDGGRSA